MSAAGEHRQLLALLSALRRTFAVQTGVDRAAKAEIRTVTSLLDRVSKRAPALQPTSHPLTRYLGPALDLADRLAPDVAAALRPIAERLPWRYGYAPRDDAPGLEHAMGWAELVGPLAPIVSQNVCFGLTLIAPQTYYSPHRHPAVELYRIVVGNPQWTVAMSTVGQAPGDAILHASNVIHAMRTQDEPLLAIYSWTGDVETPSAWV